jgi:hypothetical protein
VRTIGSQAIAEAAIGSNEWERDSRAVALVKRTQFHISRRSSSHELSETVVTFGQCCRSFAPFVRRAAPYYELAKPNVGRESVSLSDKDIGFTWSVTHHVVVPVEMVIVSDPSSP